MASKNLVNKGSQVLEEYKKELIKRSLGEQGKVTIDWTDGRKSFNIYVFSDLYLGSPLNMPKINKLIADIEQVKNDPDAIVILGGNIVSYEARKKTGFKTVEKTNMALALFEPIKDKVVAVINGPFEDSFARRDVYPAKSLAKKLGIPDRYFPNGVDLQVKVKNSYTDNTEQVVTIFATSLKSKANTFSGVGNLAEKTAIQHGMADINIFTCVNKSFAPRRVMQRDCGKSDHVELAPYYIVGNSGYKSFVNLPNNKLIEPNYSGNKIYHVVVGRNLDNDNSDKKTISKPQYKVYLERHSFGESVTTKEEVALTDELVRVKKKNTMLAKIMKSMIDEILEEVQDKAVSKANETKSVIREGRSTEEEYDTTIEDELIDEMEIDKILQDEEYDEDDEEEEL